MYTVYFDFDTVTLISRRCRKKTKTDSKIDLTEDFDGGPGHMMMYGKATNMIVRWSEVGKESVFVTLSPIFLVIQEDTTIIASVLHNDV